MTGRVTRSTIGGVPRNIDLLHKEMPTGPGGRWSRTFTEDFGEADTATLLGNGKWWFGKFSDGVTSDPIDSTETALYYRGCLTVSGGLATFTVRPNTEARYTPGNATKPNLGASISTDAGQGANPGFTMSYGFIEARLQQPAGNSTEALWPQWWTSGEDWPTTMEIDVLEGDGSDSGCSFNLHYGTTIGVDSTNLNGLGSGRTKTVSGATTGMHTYGADIRADGVTFYYDGVPVYAYSGTVPDAQRALIIGSSTAGTMSTSKTMVVDYVRAWQRI